MTFTTLLKRSLSWYWRTNAAVVAGVAIAVGVLAGSLLVGDSVRASLRRIAVERLGRTDVVVVRQTFFGEHLAAAVAPGTAPLVSGVAPLIALDGFVVHTESGRRAGHVQIVGVDDRFWRFHGVTSVSGPTGRRAYLSEALAQELGGKQGDSLLVRIQQPSAIPAGVLQGRRDEVSRSLRVAVDRTLTRREMGEFSLAAGQAAVRALFVPLERIQAAVGQQGRVNLLLVSGANADRELVPAVNRAIGSGVTADDLDVAVRIVEREHALSVESRAGFLDAVLQREVARISRESGFTQLPVLTYIANSIRVGDREVPYSVVTGVDLHRGAGGKDAVLPESSPEALPSIWLNEWTAGELAPQEGAHVFLEYFIWSDEEGLTTRRAEFSFAGVVPMNGAGGDRTLTPDYPGMTDSARMGEWDPPFPVDLGRIRPRDERYWDEFRTAPKAFVRYEDGKRLWASRFGDATSIRVFVPPTTPLPWARDRFLQRLLQAYGPVHAGLVAQPVRERSVAAARGSTDFGEYFVYFSFFLFVSALLLSALFFKLGIEQRAAEIGLLQSLGFTRGRIRRLWVTEGVLLATAGGVVGVPGAIAFCALILAGLRTWWVGAVGTRDIQLELHWTSLSVGLASGIVAAVLAILVTLRAMGQSTVRALIGQLPHTGMVARGTSVRFIGLPATVWVVLGLLSAIGLLAAAMRGIVSDTAGFFGAGALLLLTGLIVFSARLRRPAGQAIVHPGAGALVRLGARQAAWRPGRSVLVAALIASATFVIVAVGAFSREEAIDPRDPGSGTGGFRLFAESLVPLMHDPGTPEGRASLGFSSDEESRLRGVRIARFRVRPGDESSCLNLFRPANPRVVAATDAFRKEGRLRFASSIATTQEERANPWLLLDRSFPDGAVPVIGDTTSLAYAFHKGLGEDIVLPGNEGTPVVLRVVGALSNSVFQSELMISEQQFVRLFPRHEGYRFFLMDVPAEQEAAFAAIVEDRLDEFGIDVQSAVERLQAYHRVEATYLSTFQTLGGFGLILGTLGLAAVLLRNVLERRRELALLRAVGYRPAHIRAIVLSESMLLLASGVAGGVITALVAVIPALGRRGGGPAWVTTLVLLIAVVAVGIVSSIVATRAATRAGLLASLRSE